MNKSNPTIQGEKEIELIDSQIIYFNKWMSLREDRIKRVNGSFGIYGVVEKKDFAVIVALENDGITLVEQYRYPVEGRFWEFPQGSWEEKDISPEELALAELREETGLIAEKIEHIGHLFVAYGYSNQGYDIFLATKITKTKNDLDDEEVGLISKNFSVKDVEKMILDGVIKDATTIAVFGLLKMKQII